MQTLLRMGRVMLITLALVLSVSVWSAFTSEITVNAAPPDTCVPIQPVVTVTANAYRTFHIQPETVNWLTIWYIVEVRNTATNACDLKNLTIVSRAQTDTFPLEIRKLTGGWAGDLPAGQGIRFSNGSTLAWGATWPSAATIFVEGIGTAVTLCDPPCHTVNLEKHVTVPVLH